MRRVLALLCALGFVGLLAAGCNRPPVARIPLRYSGPFTCEPVFNDLPCIVCLKQHCCEPARVCNGKQGFCQCANQCLLNPTQACAEACPDAADKAMASCTATSCASICPGTGGTI